MNTFTDSLKKMQYICKLSALYDFSSWHNRLFKNASDDKKATSGAAILPIRFLLSPGLIGTKSPRISRWFFLREEFLRHREEFGHLREEFRPKFLARNVLRSFFSSRRICCEFEYDWLMTMSQGSGGQDLKKWRMMFWCFESIGTRWIKDQIWSQSLLSEPSVTIEQRDLLRNLNISCTVERDKQYLAEGKLGKLAHSFFFFLFFFFFLAPSPFQSFFSFLCIKKSSIQRRQTFIYSFSDVK